MVNLNANYKQQSQRRRLSPDVSQKAQPKLRLSKSSPTGLGHVPNRTPYFDSQLIEEPRDSKALQDKDELLGDDDLVASLEDSVSLGSSDTSYEYGRTHTATKEVSAESQLLSQDADGLYRKVNFMQMVRLGMQDPKQLI